MANLFTDLVQQPAKLRLPDAEIVYFESVLSEMEAAAYFDKLVTEISWREEAITVWGKHHIQPRLVAWHGDAGATYSYSGISMNPHPWTSTLLILKQHVERVANASFNSVLLNLYRDERDSMGWHSDDEPELGPEPVIASMSLGETREFQLRHKQRKELPIALLHLSNGSMLIMSGPTQIFWQHCIKRESKKCGKRINLTFRTIMPTVPEAKTR